MNKIALIVGWIVIGWYALKLLLLLVTVPRIFPKCPKKGFYTRYVYTTLPWVERRVWRNVWRGFYVRVPIEWAEMWQFGEDQKTLASRLLAEAKDRGADLDAFEREHGKDSDNRAWFAAKLVAELREKAYPAVECDVHDFYWESVRKLKREQEAEVGYR